MVVIDILGKPVPWTAPRVGRQSIYDPKSKEKEAARWQIKSQFREELILGPVMLEFNFYIPILKGAKGILKQQMINGLAKPLHKPDSTNLQKFYEDCMTGIVYEDDAQVCDVYSRKRYSEKPGVLIKVYSLNDELPHWLTA